MPTTSAQHWLNQAKDRIEAGENEWVVLAEFGYQPHSFANSPFSPRHVAYDGVTTDLAEVRSLIKADELTMQQALWLLDSLERLLIDGRQSVKKAH